MKKDLLGGRLPALLLLAALLLAACGPAAAPAETETRPEESAQPADTTETAGTGAENSEVRQLEDFRTWADTAVENLYAAFWNDAEGHFLRTTEGQPDPNATWIWEFGQSVFALETYYQATKSEDALRHLRRQWAYLRSSAYDQEKLKGNKDLSGDCYHAQDDAAWGAMEFMAFWRATGDEIALTYAHDLLVNSYRHWGTGEVQTFAGTQLPDLSEGLYYTKNLEAGESPFKSIYAAPMAAAALEYCMAVSPADPMSVDLYQPTANLISWLETNMCRKAPAVYRNYRGDGADLTVTYADNLYYVDYGRFGENGPTGADNPGRIEVNGSNTALFGNMAMAVCHAMLHRITGEQAELEAARRTARAIRSKETHPLTLPTYINDRDQGTNASMVGYFVRYVLSLDEPATRERKILLNTAKVIATKGRVADTPYYYTVWDSDPASHTVYYPNNSRTLAYTCQPRLANCVHMITAALLMIQLGID